MKMEAPAEHRFFHINPAFWNEQFRQSYQPYLAHNMIATGREVHNSSSKSGRLEKPKVSKICLLVSVVIVLVGLLMLVGLGVGLCYAFKPNTDPLLWAYGPDAGDRTFFGNNVIQVDTAFTGDIYILGSNDQSNEKYTRLLCPHASLVLETVDGTIGVFVTGSLGAVNVPFDNLDPTKGQFCYYRKTNSDEDKEKLCRLIGGDVFTLAKPYEAHVCTFTNYTYGGSPVGTMQLIFAMTNSKTYVIRSYEVINDIPGVTEPQFPVIGIVGGAEVFFESATVASDVRGKKQVFDLTDAATAPDLNDATPSTASGCA